MEIWHSNGYGYDLRVSQAVTEAQANVTDAENFIAVSLPVGGDLFTVARKALDDARVTLAEKTRDKYAYDKYIRELSRWELKIV